MGGVENDHGAATNTTINAFGLETVLAGGTSTGTTINTGGTEAVVGGASTRTTINGGTEFVTSGGTSHGTTINGGTEDVAAGGTAVSITFGAPGGTLDLAKPSGLIGTISNSHVGDVIDFVNTEVTSVQENAAHTILTVTYGTDATASYSLAGQQANTEFQLQSDGHGGTDLILTPIIGVASHHPFV